MKKCPNGHFAPIFSKFCPYCGSKFNLKKIYTIVAIIFTSIMLLVVFYIITTQGAQTPPAPPESIYIQSTELPTFVDPSPTITLVTKTTSIETRTSKAQTPTLLPIIGHPCSSAPPTRIEVGDMVIVTTTEGDRLTLRSSPVVADNAVDKISAGVSLRVLDGPVCSNNFTYWKVQVIGLTETGWVAEGDNYIYWLEPVY